MRALPSQASLNTVLVAGLLAIAAILGTWEGWDRVGSMVILSAVVLQPFVSVGILVFDLGGKRRFLLPGFCVASGAAATVLLAWHSRVSADPFYAALLAQPFVSFPACFAGLTAWCWWRFAGRAALVAQFARAFLAISLFSGTLIPAMFLCEHYHAVAVDRAQSYVHAIADEVRRDQTNSGRPVTEVRSLARRVGEPPPLLAASEGLTYRRAGDGFTLGFRCRAVVGVERWEYRSKDRTWTCWYD